MIHDFIEFLRTLTDPEKLIQFLSTVVTGWYSYVLLTVIVFAETGLLVGFVFPGDSLLFTIGVVCGAGQLNVWIMIGLIIVAALAGDWSGYLLGRRAGSVIMSRPDGRIFKRAYVHRTQEFYDRHGGKTIILAKFIPVVRTFAPFVAGIGKMPYSRYLPFDIVAVLSWATTMVLSGYFLGGLPFVRRNFEKIVILIILVSVAPVVWHAVKAAVKRK